MDVERKLNSVGKQAFIENFALFQDYASGRITRDSAIEKLVSLGVSNESGAAIRVGNAKLIFNNQSVPEALKLVLQSKRMTDSIINKAKRIASEIT